MTIKVGDSLPAIELHEGNPGNRVDIAKLFAGKKGVLFAVPGAFTPTCSAKHLPGYIEQADALKAKGVDAIVCLAVNDPFVMKEWGKASDAGDKVFLLPDGNGDLTRAIGMEMDGTGYGLGHRAKRFAAVVKDGTVTHLAEEPAGGVTVSGAEAILEVL